VEKITSQHKDFLYAKEIDGVGVGLFAKKPIPADSLVFQDMPYLLAPDIDSSKVLIVCDDEFGYSCDWYQGMLLIFHVCRVENCVPIVQLPSSLLVISFEIHPVHNIFAKLHYELIQ
jgi:hypothetical protein